MSERPKINRAPVLAAGMFLIALVLLVRGVRVDDRLGFRTVATEAGGSMVVTEKGLRAGRMGAGLFYREQLIVDQTTRRRVSKTPTAVPDVGFFHATRPLEPAPVWRWLGLGVERRGDERPESFESDLAVSVPLWLLVALLAVRPVRYLHRKNRDRARTPNPTNGGIMKGPMIAALAAGVLLGTLGTYLAVRQTHPADPPAGAAAATDAEADPKQPIVGPWRTSVAGLVEAIYTFKKDGTFTLSLMGIPPLPVPGVTAPAAQAGQPTQGLHHAGGTWRIDGDLLKMHDTSSTSPYTVVGDDEEARVVSVADDTLVLENRDKHGKPERLEFERVRPFVKGAIENKTLVGKWTSPGGITLVLRDSGDAEILTGSRRRPAEWSQRGKRLRMMVMPPDKESSDERAVRQWRSRNGATAVAGPTEWAYDIVDVSPEGGVLWLEQLRPGRGKSRFERVPGG